jgi:hypothetical protein
MACGSSCETGNSAAAAGAGILEWVGTLLLNDTRPGNRKSASIAARNNTTRTSRRVARSGRSRVISSQAAQGCAELDERPTAPAAATRHHPGWASSQPKPPLPLARISGRIAMNRAQTTRPHQCLGETTCPRRCNPDRSKAEGMRPPNLIYTRDGRSIKSPVTTGVDCCPTPATAGRPLAPLAFAGAGG